MEETTSLQLNETKQLIDPRELRIGNLLIYKGKIVHVTMLSLDIDDEYQDTIGFCEQGKSTNEHSDWNKAMYGELSGIPLTPEILQKAGFKEETKMHELAPNKWVFRKGIILCIVASKLYLASGPKPKMPYRFMFAISGMEGDVFIEKVHVHGLQNLFFVLTNDELNIEL